LVIQSAARLQANMMASPRRESADVLLCQRKIKSLEQENAMLKERLASLTALEHQIDRQEG
jgi:hypothetical protein